MADTLEVIIKGTDEISGVLGSIGGNMQRLGGIALGAAVGGVAALGAGLAYSVGQAAEAQQVQAQLNAVIASTGGAAGLTADEVNAMATSLSQMTTFGDDAIIQGQNLLLTFTNIGEDVFPRATETMLDMATALGTDASGSAIQLGKALNDPIQGISALSRVGVTFTEEQKEMIAAMVETGDVAGAQTVILDELAKEFGGSAAAAADTFTGRMTQLKNMVGEVGETVGTAFLPLLQSLAERALPLVTSAMEAIQPPLAAFVGMLETGAGAFEELINGLLSGEDIVGDFANFFWTMAGAMGATEEQALNVYNRVIGLRDIFDAFTAALQPIIQNVMAFVEQFVSWQDVLTAVGLVIASVVLPAIYGIITTLAPLIALFLAIVGVVSLLRNVWESDFMGIRTALIEFWEVTARPFFEQLWQWLSVNVPLALETLRAWWVDIAWPAILQAVQFVWPIVQAIFQAYVFYITDIFVPAVTRLWNFWVNVAWPAIQRAMEIVWPVVKFVLEAMWQSLTTVILPAIQALYEFWVNTAWPAIKQAVNDAWVVIQPLLEQARQWLSENVPQALASLQSAWSSIWGSLSAMVDPAIATVNTILTAVQDFWNFLSSHVFNFQVNLPDLPDWAIPGSPLPIHTAWEDFNNYMSNAAFGMGGPQGQQNNTSNKSIVMNTNVYTSAIDLRDASEMGAKFAYGGI